jgi:hypothetical protein
MATFTAKKYRQAATSSQNGQIVINRHVWDCEVAAAADKVLIGRLPAGHRLVPELCALQANATIPVGNVDVYVNAAANADAPTNLLWNDQAFVASTAERNAVDSGAYLMAETIGVDFEYDRDIVVLINSGFATAPAGAKVLVQIASVAVAAADYP